MRVVPEEHITKKENEKMPQSRKKFSEMKNTEKDDNECPELILESTLHPNTQT